MWQAVGSVSLERRKRTMREVQRKVWRCDRDGGRRPLENDRATLESDTIISSSEIEKAVKSSEKYFQEAKADKGKPRLSLVPTQAVIGIARIREYGCSKYPVGGEDNWKQVEPQRYIDALLRHAFAFKDDPYGVDKESGLPHLWHIGCNYAFLSELLGDKYEDEMR